MLLMLDEFEVLETSVDAGRLDREIFGFVRHLMQSRGRVSFLSRDMTSFNLRRRFPLIVTPFHSFQSLLSVADQRRSLQAFRRHLAPGGRLILNAFVPIAEQLAGEPVLVHMQDSLDPVTGGKVALWSQSRMDHLNQVADTRQIIEVLDPRGRMVERHYRDFQLRYTFRFELQHLLELSGFEFEELYGDFQRSPFDESSREQVWVVRRAI